MIKGQTVLISVNDGEEWIEAEIIAVNEDGTFNVDVTNEGFFENIESEYLKEMN